MWRVESGLLTSHLKWCMHFIRYGMKPAARKIELVFYRSPTGNEPVRDW